MHAAINVCITVTWAMAVEQDRKRDRHSAVISSSANFDLLFKLIFSELPKTIIYSESQPKDLPPLPPVNALYSRASFASVSFIFFAFRPPTVLPPLKHTSIESHHHHNNNNSNSSIDGEVRQLSSTTTSDPAKPTTTNDHLTTPSQPTTSYFDFRPPTLLLASSTTGSMATSLSPSPSKPIELGNEKVSTTITSPSLPPIHSQTSHDNHNHNNNEEEEEDDIDPDL